MNSFILALLLLPLTPSLFLRVCMCLYGLYQYGYSFLKRTLRSGERQAQLTSFCAENRIKLTPNIKACKIKVNVNFRSNSACLFSCFARHHCRPRRCDFMGKIVANHVAFVSSRRRCRRSDGFSCAAKFSLGFGGAF